MSPDFIMFHNLSISKTPFPLWEGYPTILTSHPSPQPSFMDQRLRPPELQPNLCLWARHHSLQVRDCGACGCSLTRTYVNLNPGLFRSIEIVRPKGPNKFSGPRAHSGPFPASFTVRRYTHRKTHNISSETEKSLVSAIVSRHCLLTASP